MAKIIAVDFGYRRIGIALGDPEIKIAFPHCSIDTQKTHTFTALRRIITQHHCTTLLLGLPLGPDGKDTEISLHIRHFAEQIQTHIKIPVILVDERFSTHEAKQLLKELGNSPRKHKHTEHSLAAQVILKDYFARLQQ